MGLIDAARAAGKAWGREHNALALPSDVFQALAQTMAPWHVRVPELIDRDLAERIQLAFMAGAREAVEAPDLRIRFWGGGSLPMYGSSVSELHLDIDGVHYVVKAFETGKPVLLPA